MTLHIYPSTPISSFLTPLSYIVRWSQNNTVLYVHPLHIICIFVFYLSLPPKLQQKQKDQVSCLHPSASSLKRGTTKSAASTRMNCVRSVFSFFSPATTSVSLWQKHPVVYVAIIPCDMGSQGEGIGGLGEKDRGWQLDEGGKKEVERRKRQQGIESLSLQNVPIKDAPRGGGSLGRN